MFISFCVQSPERTTNHLKLNVYIKHELLPAFVNRYNVIRSLWSIWAITQQHNTTSQNTWNLSTMNQFTPWFSKFSVHY